MRKTARLLVVWLIASVIAGGLALLSTWPWHPHSALGWCVLLIAALPIMAGGQYLVDRIILGGAVGQQFDALGSGGTASTVRIWYVASCVIVIGIVAICAIAWLNKSGWLGAL